MAPIIDIPMTSKQLNLSSSFVALVSLAILKRLPQPINPSIKVANAYCMEIVFIIIFEFRMLQPPLPIPCRGGGKLRRHLRKRAYMLHFHNFRNLYYFIFTLSSTYNYSSVLQRFFQLLLQTKTIFP